MKKSNIFLTTVLALALTGCGAANTSDQQFNDAVSENAHEHDWIDATCEEPKTCSICGEIEGEALGHDWDLTVDRPTCTRCSETRDGTPTELIDNVDIFSDNDSNITWSCGNDWILAEISFDSDVTLDFIKDSADIIYDINGSLGDLKDNIDFIYESVFSDTAEELANLSIFSYYCGSNLKTYTVQIYWADSLAGTYKNGIITYDFFIDELSEYGYYHF